MSPGWKPSTWKTQAGYRRVHFDGAFAGTFIDQIAPADVLAWIAQISNASGPSAANRCLSILNAMMRKAEEWGVRPTGSNPCAGVRAKRARPRERFLSDAEFARLGAALARAAPAYPNHVMALRLLLLTGCRKSEILNLRWREVRGSRLLLDDSKTGARTVWLSVAAQRLLMSLKRGQPDSLVIVLSTRCRGTLDHIWRRIRADAGLNDVRLHDLRHSFASYAARQSETLPMIGKLLGHAKIASTARYTHLDDGVVLAAATRVGALVEHAMAWSPPMPRDAFIGDPSR